MSLCFFHAFIAVPLATGAPTLTCGIVNKEQHRIGIVAITVHSWGLTARLFVLHCSVQDVWFAKICPRVSRPCNPEVSEALATCSI